MEDGSIDYRILLIQICRERMHKLEFVKPIEDILKKNKIKFVTLYYKDITKKLLVDIDKIIISGTSLKDCEYLRNLDNFKWILDFKKPILGICAGMHILCLLFNGKIERIQEIGITCINYTKNLFGAIGKIEVFELHNYAAVSDEFNIIAKSNKCVQCIEHKNNPYYGLLYHPEVKNKSQIIDFVID